MWRLVHVECFLRGVFQVELQQCQEGCGNWPRTARCRGHTGPGSGPAHLHAGGVQKASTESGRLFDFVCLFVCFVVVVVLSAKTQLYWYSLH